MSPFTSPKEKSTLTSAETRHSAKVNQYRRVDGAQVGLQPLLGPSAPSVGPEGQRLQTLLPNLRKGGGGALILDGDQGARDTGLGPGRYGDAADMIENCIEQARQNV